MVDSGGGGLVVERERKSLIEERICGILSRVTSASVAGAAGMNQALCLVSRQPAHTDKEHGVTELDRDQACELARKTLAHHRSALEALSESLDDAFWTCARWMCDCQGLIWTTGVGTSAAVAQQLAHLLVDGGARSMFLSPAEELHGHTAVMAPGDLLLAISRWGESSEVIQMAEIDGRREVPAVALVHDTSSMLACTCRHVVPVRSPWEYDLMSTAHQEYHRLFGHGRRAVRRGAAGQGLHAGGVADHESGGAVGPGRGG
jgi:D-arabinose 5-phosphate isomerase GutQ